MLSRSIAVLMLCLGLVVDLPCHGANLLVEEHYAALSWLRYVDSQFWLDRKFTKIDSARELSEEEFAERVSRLNNAFLIEEDIATVARDSRPNCFVVRAVKPAGYSGIWDVLSDGSRLVVRYSFLHSDVVTLRRTAILVCGVARPVEVFVNLNPAQ